MRWKEFDKYRRFAEEGKCPWCETSINKTGKKVSGNVYFLPENKKIGGRGMCNNCRRIFETPEISSIEIDRIKCGINLLKLQRREDKRERNDPRQRS